MAYLDEILSAAKASVKDFNKLNNEERNKCLLNIADALMAHRDEIMEANIADIEAARANGLKESMIERLTLNEKRLQGLVDSVKEIVALKSPVFDVMEEYKRPNGMVIKKIRVPFGVIGVIFESRPNVSVDIAALCIKTGNVCVLKGGKEAINTNKMMVRVMKDAIKDIVNPDIITLIEATDRETTDEFITKKEYVDLLIPRGSKGLIQYVVKNAKIPYIETGAGNCHLYVEASADLDMALNIAVNAKYQRPSVCNAIENILVDEKVASKFLPMLYEKFSELKIEMRGDEKTRAIIPVNVATDEDFYTEYNDYIVSIKVVTDVSEAIDHINEHSSKHSESIITENEDAKNRFFTELDSACLYHNVSTRFTDGGEFGFGAEIGISTAKLHARGPMGLNEIMTYRYVIEGNGQVRG